MTDDQPEQDPLEDGLEAEMEDPIGGQWFRSELSIFSGGGKGHLKLKIITSLFLFQMQI